MDLSIDKRERILAAAATLIVRNGLQCSMSAIAEEAGVATGSLYNYFDSKEALVRGVYGRVTEQMTELVSVETDEAMPHDVRVQRYIAKYLDFIQRDPLRAALFDYLDNTPFITLGDAKVIFQPFVDYAIDLIAAAQAAGVVRPGAPTMLASYVRGAIRNSIKRRRMRTDPITSEELDLIADMCWQALAAR
jgi:AcrR family transcriptional regulator